MPFLPPEIILLVAEHADLATILSLMCSCRSFHSSIIEHERSIVKGKLDRYRMLVCQLDLHHPQDQCRQHQITQNQHLPDHDQQVRDSREHGLLDQHSWDHHKQNDHLAAPCGTVLSSATHEREPLPPYTFGVIQELDLRESRADILFRHGGPLDDIIRQSTIWGIAGHNDHEIAALLARLRRAARLADRLADCTAAVIVSQRSRIGSRSRPCNPSRAARQAQLRLLRSSTALSTPDLIFLACLASFCGTTHADHRARHHDSDPDFWDKVVAFQESVLRHGATVVLWGALGGAHGSGDLPPPICGGCAGPPTAMASFVDRAVRSVVRELRAWEMGGWASGGDDEDGQEAIEFMASPEKNGGVRFEMATEGKGMLPGLHMTMWRAVANRLDSTTDEVGRHIDYFVLRAVRDV